MRKKTVMMLETRKGSQDGVTVETFEKNTKCEIESSLAEVFVGQKWAIGVSEPDMKDQGGAPENKDLGGAGENKGGFPEETGFPDAGKGKGIKLWTKEELDQLDMNGLREIGDPMGVKDTKKTELIKEILQAQDKPKGTLQKIKDKFSGK